MSASSDFVTEQFLLHTPPSVGKTNALSVGQEWLVDASGCPPARLTDQRVLASFFEALIIELKLQVVGTPQWHVFPQPGGITGLALLSESHLAIHTFPEHGYAALSIYSCRTQPEPELATLVKKHLGATSLTVRIVPREARYP